MTCLDYLSVVDRHRRRDHICWSVDQKSRSSTLRVWEGDNLERQADPPRRIWAGLPRAQPFGRADDRHQRRDLREPRPTRTTMRLADRACAAVPASSPCRCVVPAERITSSQALGAQCPTRSESPRRPAALKTTPEAAGLVAVIAG